MTQAAKTDAQIAHEARNAVAKKVAAEAKAQRMLMHRNRNFNASVDALARRDARAAAHLARNAATSMAAAEAKAKRMAIHADRNDTIAQIAADGKSARIAAHNARNAAAKEAKAETVAMAQTPANDDLVIAVAV